MPLHEVLVEELRDLFSAENQLVKALPKMAKGAESPELKELITSHLDETKGQVERLQQIFGSLGEKPTGKKCKGMEGLIAEGQEALEEDEEGAAFDLGICGGALRVEHYEIAGYTACIAMAKTLDMTDVVDLLTETLQEEQAAAEKIMAAAEPMMREAAGESEEDDEEGEDEGEEYEAEEDDEEEEEEQEESSESASRRPAAKKSASRPRKSSGGKAAAKKSSR